MNKVKQIVIYLTGSDRSDVTTFEMLLEIPEIGCINPDSMSAVPHLLQFLQITFRKRRTAVFLFPGPQLPNGGIVDKSHLYITVKELRKHKVLFRQIGFAAHKLNAFLFRQRYPQAVIIKGCLYELPAIPDGRRKFDSGLVLVYVHINSFLITVLDNVSSIK